MLRMSSSFIRTLREDPSEAEFASHKLLVRAGYIRRVSPGVYTLLPLGLKVMRKIEQIVREEMDSSGAQELLFPALLPKEPYEATGRWEEYGDNLFRLTDRKGADHLLAPTHEEMFTLAVKDLFSSYKDLPINLYQIQTKYRDEARPRAGLLRVREFVMKDAYSFDLNDEGLAKSYEIMRSTYQRIFARLGLEIVIAKADAGAMGGSRSEEFLHPTKIGEDTFVVSEGGYIANVEAVTTLAPPPLPAAQIAKLQQAELIKTPNTTTISELVEFLNNSESLSAQFNAEQTLKAMAYIETTPEGIENPILILIPGNRQVDEKRLEVALAPNEVRGFEDHDFEKYPEFVKGYMGPVGFGLKLDSSADASRNGYKLLVDPRVQAGTVWISGANQADTHYLNLVAGRDFTPDGFIEAAEILDGDPAPDGSGVLKLTKGMEMGHIFQLGKKYSTALDLKVLNEQGKQEIVTMGSYGIGLTRAIAAIAETYHDEKGLVWPKSVAPVDVHLIATGKDRAVFETAEKIATELEAQGIEVLYDDREKVSPGVKFKDSELLGIPFGVVVGRGLEQNLVEIRTRASAEVEEVAVADAVKLVVSKVFA